MIYLTASWPADRTAAWRAAKACIPFLPLWLGRRSAVLRPLYADIVAPAVPRWNPPSGQHAGRS